MQTKLLIFDFDGTIADTFNHLVKISNRLASEFHYKTILPEDINYLKDKNSPEIIKFLKVPIHKIPRIVFRAKTELNKEINSIQPIENLKKVLLQLKSNGIKLGILTSNSKENVLRFLNNHSMDFFDFISTTSRIWGKHIGLFKIMKGFIFSQDQIVYIGDEIRDIVTAKKAGVKSAAVTWGYNSAKALSKYRPDFLINCPDELLKIL